MLIAVMPASATAQRADPFRRGHPTQLNALHCCVARDLYDGERILNS